MDFLENKFFLLALTFVFFFGAKVLQKKTGFVLLNPILITIALLIVFLRFTGISYDTYQEGGYLIEFWLKPAVVALGVPLYLQLETIKKQLLPIIISELVGCLVGIVSVVLVAKLLGATQEVIVSLASKSVTTPIAMEVTQAVGGHTLAHGRRGGVCGHLRGDIRLQGVVARPCQESHRTGALHGDRFPCRGYLCCHGGKWQVWRLCQPRPHPQRHLHRPAHPHDTPPAGVALTPSPLPPFRCICCFPVEFFSG